MALARYSIAILLKMYGVRLTTDCCIGWCVVAWGQHDGAAWRECGNWQKLELLVVVVVLWVMMSLDPVGGYYGYHCYWGVCWLRLVRCYILRRRGRILQEWSVWWLTDWLIVLMHVRCGLQELPSRLTCIWHPNVQQWPTADWMCTVLCRWAVMLSYGFFYVPYSLDVPD